MSDNEILEKYVDLEKSILSEAKWKEVMVILYKYTDVFSLRDELDTHPNLEAEIDLTEEYPFFFQSISYKRRDKTIIDKEMKMLYYLGIIKGFSVYSSPVMLIS